MPEGPASFQYLQRTRGVDPRAGHLSALWARPLSPFTRLTFKYRERVNASWPGAWSDARLKLRGSKRSCCRHHFSWGRLQPRGHGPFSSTAL